MAPQHTFVTPGQRYAEVGLAAWRTEHQLTVVHVGRDGCGLARVTCLRASGHRLVLPAAEFEAAVAAGQIVPVAGAGLIRRAA